MLQTLAAVLGSARPYLAAQQVHMVEDRIQFIDILMFEQLRFSSHEGAFMDWLVAIVDILFTFHKYGSTPETSRQVACINFINLSSVKVVGVR